MSNAFMETAIIKMKESQKSAIEQLDKYKALGAALEIEIRDRSQAITLLESALNPEKAHLSLRDAMK